MKKQLIFILFCIGSIQLTVAQNFTHEFGMYSSEEFQLQQYDKDPTAEAVVIYDIGESHFGRDDNGFFIVFTHKMKIKVLTKAGLKWAEISIPFYEENRKYEQISELKGNTYNYENGQVRKSAFDPKNAYDEKFNEHWYNKKFAMPDVKEGSVIEVSYQIKSPYLFNFRGWEFQKRIPVIYSEYTTKMIPFYEYTYLMQGAAKFDDFKNYVADSPSSPLGALDYRDMVYVFVMKDLPAFKDESFITSIDDHIVKLDFQLSVIHSPYGGNQAVMTTWPKLSKELLDNTSFGKYQNASKKKCAEIIDTMQISTKTTTEKAKSIERLMKSNFNWNGHNDKFASKSVKEFLTSKTGNCADINLFMAGMLNEAGIEAYPVILSTRDHGQIKTDYPFHHFFNYVIVLAKIDSSSVLLDATEPFCKFTEIPSRCINNMGLIIQKDKTEWVKLKSKSVSSISYIFELQTNQNKDSLTQNCKLVTTGLEAISYRNKYTTSYNELKADLLGRNSLTNDSLNAVNLTHYEKPLKIVFSNKIPLETVEDKIIISPFCNYTITENPLKQPVRNYPVDFTYRKSYLFQSTIEIPSGYKLLVKPEDLIVNTSKVRIVFRTDTQKKDSVVVVGNYEFKKDVYDVSDYTDLRSYFNSIVDKFNEKFVFVKI